MEATSEGAPMRPIGVRDMARFMAVLSARTPRAMSVSMVPGPMALTLIPWGARAMDVARVNCETPPFDMQ